MGFITSATVTGKSRADGPTDRPLTLLRVADVSNGFVLRESVATAPNQDLAQSVIHRSYEAKASDGKMVRHSATTYVWPYELPTDPGVVAGAVTQNKNGLHIPVNCPVNVKKDIRHQMTQAASGSVATSLSYHLVANPMDNGDHPF